MLSLIIPITDLTHCILYELARVMLGTKHQDDCYFYHDELSMLTSKSHMKYIEEREEGCEKFLEQWLLLMNNLNIGTPITADR